MAKRSKSSIPATPRSIPRIYVLAGTNGAGKSSIGGAMIQASGGLYFNPDEAAREIRLRSPHLSQTQANSAAWHEGKRLLQQAIKQRQNYAFETTLGGRTITQVLIDAAQAGYEIRVWFAGLKSVEMHLARVQGRVTQGGHDIPEADIRRRFDHSRLQLIKLLPWVTELRLYDNSFEADLSGDVAPRPQLVLHWQRQLVPNMQAASPEAARARCGYIVGPKDLRHTPEWAKPIVAAVLKLLNT